MNNLDIKTIKDLKEALLRDEQPIVKIIGDYIWDEFELDKGCLLRFTSYTGNDGHCEMFNYSFEEFKEFNRTLLKSTWYDSKTKKFCLTAEQYGAWERKNMPLYLMSDSTLEESGFEIYNGIEAVNAEIIAVEKKLETLKELKKTLEGSI